MLVSLHHMFRNYLLLPKRCQKTTDNDKYYTGKNVRRADVPRPTGVGVDSSSFSSAESSLSLRPLEPLLYCCSSASSFICSQSSRLKSFSVLAPSRRTRRSVSANRVANVRPVSSAFFVPFCTTNANV